MSTTVYGVDFSGAKTCGSSIWIAEGRVDVENDHLTIETLQSATERFGVRTREDVLQGLKDLLRDAGESVIGFDFPFGFPEETHSNREWAGFLEEFASRFDGKQIDSFPGEYGRDGRPKREIDYRFGGQSPLSPQIKYQVFYGLRDLIHPLVTEDDIRVLPMQDSESGKPRVIEVYPAATFGVERLYRTGYKAHDAASRKRREQNAKHLQKKSKVAIPDEALVEHAIESDDALDALAATIAVQRALTNGFETGSTNTIEGHIYA